MVNKVSETAREKILRKTPYAHSVRPSDDGMGSGQVKKMFYQAVTDREDSALAEVDRVVDEVNAELDTKVNNEDVVDIIDRDSLTGKVASALAVVNYCDNAQNTFRLYYTDIYVPVTAWVEDETLEGFGYRAFVPLPDVKGSMIPEVFFSPQDAAMGKGLANIAEAVEGGVNIYGMYLPVSTVVIDVIYLNTPNVYSVVVKETPHVHIEVEDGTVRYRNGDYALPGTVLTVSWTVDQGYVGTVTVGHREATSPATYRVSGTVWIESSEEVVDEG